MTASGERPAGRGDERGDGRGDERGGGHDGGPADGGGRDEWDAGRIRRLRGHLGLTQAGMSELLNARQQTISEWERGRYRPRGPSARLLSYVAEDAGFEYGDDDPDDDPEDDPDDGG